MLASHLEDSREMGLVEVVVLEWVVFASHLEDLKEKEKE